MKLMHVTSKNSDLSKVHGPGIWAHLSQPISSVTCVLGKPELFAAKYFRNSTFVVYQIQL